MNKNVNIPLAQGSMSPGPFAILHLHNGWFYWTRKTDASMATPIRGKRFRQVGTDPKPKTGNDKEAKRRKFAIASLGKNLGMVVR